eukprot:scaffold12055_cov22-Tisochrysis_lutea.AAC.2
MLVQKVGGVLASVISDNGGAQSAVAGATFCLVLTKNGKVRQQVVSGGAQSAVAERQGEAAGGVGSLKGSSNHGMRKPPLSLSGYALWSLSCGSKLFGGKCLAVLKPRNVVHVWQAIVWGRVPGGRATTPSSSFSGSGAATAPQLPSSLHSSLHSLVLDSSGQSQT